MKATFRISAGIAACGVLQLASSGFAGVTEVDVVAESNWSNTFWGALQYVRSDDLVNSGQSTLKNVSANNYEVVQGQAAALNDGVAGDGLWASGSYCYFTGTLSVTFTLNTDTNTGGYDITGINTFASWNGLAAVSQHYLLTYTTVGDSTTKTLCEVNYSPTSASDPWATVVYLTSNTADAMASHVNSITLTAYTDPSAGISAVFREIDMMGAASAPIPEATSLSMLFLGGVTLFSRRTR